MGVLNLAGLSIVGWVAAWRFDSVTVQQCVPFFNRCKKNNRVGWDFENTMKKKRWYLKWYHLFFIIFLFCFFGGLKLEVDE